MGQPVDNARPSVLYTGAGTSVDCSTTWGWVSTPACWKYSPSAWDQMNQFGSFIEGQPLPTPPPPVDLANTQNGMYSGTPAQQEAQYAAAVNASLTAGSAASQAAMLQYFQENGPNVAPDCGMFQGSPQLQDDGVTWKCSGFSTTMILIAAAALGGVVLLTGSRRR